MQVTKTQIFKVIKGLAFVALVSLSLNSAWADTAARGPSSVDETDEWSEESTDENTDTENDESAPSKLGVTKLPLDLAPAKPTPPQDLLIRADIPFQSKQSFVNAFMDLIAEGESEVYDAGQPLTREFQSAYEARRRVNHCNRFIQEDGEYGEYGELIDATLRRFPELQRELLSNAAGAKAGMRSVCPRFTSLNPVERREFWVWVMTSLALYESTCGFDTSNSNNSNAVGIFQLHRSTADRLPRSLISNQRCGRLGGAEIARPQENIVCTLDFIRDGFSGRMDHAPAGLITRAQQFQKLRTENTNLVKLIRKFRACQPVRRLPVS